VNATPEPVDRALDARGLELIRLDDGSVVAKRGVREVRLGDVAASALLERVAVLLDGTRTTQALLAELPAADRALAVEVLAFLLERGLVGDAGTPDTPEGRFWRTFGPYGVPAPERLRAARVAVTGDGRIARTLVEQLAACGVGHVDAVSADEVAPGTALVCAASDEGESAALMDAARAALEAELPFLPVWAAELVGYVGPLTEPFETACLRCYQLRVESNSAHPDAVRAIREHRAATPAACDASGMLPPMATALAAVAAMEAVKRLAGFAPADVTGYVVELNLVSFSSNVRRVLKLPRCPECGDTLRRTPVALTRGPQVPGR